VKKILSLSLYIIISLSSVSFAETTQPIQVLAQKESENDFHLEIGGNYSSLNNDYGQWKAFDFRLKYTGNDKIAPILSLSTLSRKEGTQQVYGVGSYIYVAQKFYMIAGISGAPVRNPDIIYSPRLRMDLSGYLNVPMVDGLVVSTGITHLPEQSGASADIFSLGAIYYGKIILTGSLNYNVARPGNIISLAGQTGIMYGWQGKYWIGGGVSFGRVAYQSVSDIPFNVRYRSNGANIFYNKWIGKNWGINNRLDYLNQMGFYKLIGLTTSLFFDF
jgi:YaiO family outer membrane protein